MNRPGHEPREESSSPSSWGPRREIFTCAMVSAGCGNRGALCREFEHGAN
jgi:hypothetical protein